MEVIVRYWAWLWTKMRRKLWWQTILYGLIGLITAILAFVLDDLITWRVPLDISRADVSGLLNIISSSMLAVTTFSLGAMTTAFSGATNNVTPRATLLLMEDRITQEVLSTFIGTFVFSVFALIFLATGVYGPDGRAFLFAITILAIAIIVIQLLRWVNHLISLGRVGSTIDRIETATLQALTERQNTPYLGAHPWFDMSQRPEGLIPIHAETINYISFIDLAALSKIAEISEIEIWLPCNAGTLTYHNTVIAWVQGEITEELRLQIHDQFVFGSTRRFEQDPRFGLIVLAEVGSRALSPATNDAGTAIDVIIRLTRLLAQWSKGRDEAEVEYPRLHLHPLRSEDLFDDAFSLILRDGAHLFEIQLRLLKSLRVLATMGDAEFRDAAQKLQALALHRAQDGTLPNCDMERLTREAQTKP